MAEFSLNDTGRGGGTASGLTALGGGRRFAAMEPPICPLCGRPIPPGARASLHHLIPRLKGGAGGPVVRLHQICHDAIHAALTEGEIARSHGTIEALRAHPRIARFIAWVKDRPPDLHAPTAGPRRLRRR